VSDEKRGLRAARLVVMRASAFLVVVVAVVNAGFVSPGNNVLPLWYGALGITAGAVTLGVGLLSSLLGTRTLRAGAAVAVAMYVVFVALFPLAAHAGHVERMPWPLTASSATVAAALVAGGMRWGWMTVLYGAAAGVLYRLVFGGFDVDGVINDAHAVLTASVICVLGGYVLSSGAVLDDAAAARREAGSREYAEKGRLAARTRTAALVHDEALATLALAASPLPVPTDRLATQARRAADMLTRLVDDDAGGAELLEAALAAEARAFGAEFVGPAENVPPLPPATREAILGAARQALDNARRHAPGARRSLSVRASGGVVEVEIADDGEGFDPSRIADDRLGVRQSIVGRMARLPGTAARVESAPGEGTRVVLSYVPASAAEVTALGDRRSLLRGTALVGVGFVALQVLCAIVMVINAPSSWPRQLAILLVVVVAAEVLRRSPGLVPTRGRTIVVVAAAVLGAVITMVAAPMTYGELWPIVALAFLLVGVAVRGRFGVALVAAAVVVAVVVVGGIIDRVPVGQILTLTTRPALIVVMATVMLLIVRRMQRRVAALHDQAVAAAEQESWSRGASAELRERTDDLARTVVPLLSRIGEGLPVSDADRREYAALEGSLRDGLRAGALSREPLRGAVAAARGRGVDVVLLDDSDQSLSDTDIRAVTTWMVDAVAQAQRSAVGRLLPPGRQTVASVTIDGRPLLFEDAAHGTAEGAAQGSVTSFQGE
jgi:signal transduction histidine kinase